MLPSRTIEQLLQLSPRPHVFLVMLFKETSPATLVLLVEYYRLLGVTHAVLIDNNCGASSARTSGTSTKTRFAPGHWRESCASTRETSAPKLREDSA